jgi:hypothetical protein
MDDVVQRPVHGRPPFLPGVGSFEVSAMFDSPAVDRIEPACRVRNPLGAARPFVSYTGFTEDLHARLKHHNSGGDPHTAKYGPWRVKTAIAFTDRKQALAFERRR